MEAARFFLHRWARFKEIVSREQNKKERGKVLSP
jgi:hypothetical protein